MLKVTCLYFDITPLGLPRWHSSKESAYQCRRHKRCGFDPRARDAALILGSGRSTGVEKGIPLQYSCLENSLDRGAWQVAVHGVAKSQTRLSTCTHTHTSHHLTHLFWEPGTTCLIFPFHIFSVHVPDTSRCQWPHNKIHTNEWVIRNLCLAFGIICPTWYTHTNTHTHIHHTHLTGPAWCFFNKNKLN